MSRILRITHWPHPAMPTMVAMLEDDMKVSAEEAVEQMLAAGQGFFTYYIGEAESNDIAAETVRCAQQAKETEEVERNMAITYQWYANGLSMVREDGAFASTEAPPYDREQAAWVLRSIARHPNYKRHKFFIPLRDGTVIEMKEGEVLPA